MRNINSYRTKLDCARRAQTSAEAKVSTKSDPGFEAAVGISGLIRTRFRMSAGSLPKCIEFILLSASVI